MELKQRVFYNKSPTSYHSIQTSIESATTTTNTPYQQRLLIRKKKLERTGLQILKLERQLYQCQTKFDEELNNMWQNHRKGIEDKQMPITLSNLIEQRFTLITNIWREMYMHRLLYYVEASYAECDALETQKQSGHEEQQLPSKVIGYEAQLINHTQYTFTDQQLQLLSRGPTYVPPYQLHVSPLCTSSDDVLKKLYAPLKHRLAYLFMKYEIPVTLQFTIQQDIYNQFTKSFSQPLPVDLQQRAQNEQVLVQKIRGILKKNNLILRRTADDQNTFYVGYRQAFEQQADEHVRTSNYYDACFTANEQAEQPQAFRTELTKTVNWINYALCILRRRNEINEDLYNRLRTDIDHVKLPYLYFLPNISQVRDDSFE